MMCMCMWSWVLFGVFEEFCGCECVYDGLGCVFGVLCVVCGYVFGVLFVCEGIGGRELVGCV